MEPAARLQHLTTVSGSFHARLLAARLGADDVLVELRGLSEGPYPLQGAVEVWVEADRLELARELLLADEVEDAFASEERTPGDGEGDGDATGLPVQGSAVRGLRRPRPGRLPVALALGVVLLLVVVLLAGH